MDKVSSAANKGEPWPVVLTPEETKQVAGGRGKRSDAHLRPSDLAPRRAACNAGAVACGEERVKRQRCRRAGPATGLGIRSRGALLPDNPRGRPVTAGHVTSSRPAAAVRIPVCAGRSLVRVRRADWRGPPGNCRSPVAPRSRAPMPFASPRAWSTRWRAAAGRPRKRTAPACRGVSGVTAL